MLGGVLDDHPLAALEPAADDPVAALQGVGADLHVFHHAPGLTTLTTADWAVRISASRGTVIACGFTARCRRTCT